MNNFEQNQISVKKETYTILIDSEPSKPYQYPVYPAGNPIRDLSIQSYLSEMQEPSNFESHQKAQARALTDNEVIVTLPPEGKI